MRHPVGIILTTISLLLCVLFAAASIVTCVMPFAIIDEHKLSDSQSVWRIDWTILAAARGRLYVRHYDLVRMRPLPAGVSAHHIRQTTTDVAGWFAPSWRLYEHTTSWVGLASTVPDTLTEPGKETNSQWSAPFWVLIPPFAILPVRWAVLRRRQTRRDAARMCVRCGYDLRASREKCPDCGEPIRSDR